MATYAAPHFCSFAHDFAYSRKHVRYKLTPGRELVQLNIHGEIFSSFGTYCLSKIAKFLGGKYANELIHSL